ILNPPVESTCIEPGSLILVHLFKAWRNPCFNRALPQQFGTERMNRAYVRFFKPCQRVFEMLNLFNVCCCCPCGVEFNPEPQPQLAGGLACECNGDDPVDGGFPGFKSVDDAANQFGRLAGAGRRLNDQALVERITDSLPGGFVPAHAVSRTSFKSGRRAEEGRTYRQPYRCAREPGLHRPARHARYPLPGLCCRPLAVRKTTQAMLGSTRQW